MQTFRNMTETTKTNINDIIAGFRRRYVKTQSIATARCKWENLTFDPANQTFQDFLESIAPRFIETLFYAKMPAHLKRVLNQAHLESASCATMVQHLEREMELNGLANPESATFTGIHNVKPTNNLNQERPPKTASTCFGCGHQGHLLRNCRKTNIDKRTQKTPTQTTPTPAKLVVNLATKPRIAIRVRTGQTAPHGGRHLNQQARTAYLYHNQPHPKFCNNPKQTNNHRPRYNNLPSQKTIKATSSLRGLHRFQILYHL